STVTLSKPHCAIISAEKPEGIASQAFTTALPEAQICLTLFGIDRVSSCRFLDAGSPPAGTSFADAERRVHYRRPAIVRQGRAVLRPFSPLGADLGVTAEIGGADGFVAPEFVRLAAQHDTAGLQHVSVVGNRQTHARILLDKQDRGVAPDFAD